MSGFSSDSLASRPDSLASLPQEDQIPLQAPPSAHHDGNQAGKDVPASSAPPVSAAALNTPSTPRCPISVRSSLPLFPQGLLSFFQAFTLYTTLPNTLT